MDRVRDIILASVFINQELDSSEALHYVLGAEAPGHHFTQIGLFPGRSGMYDIRLPVLDTTWAWMHPQLGWLQPEQRVRHSTMGGAPVPGMLGSLGRQVVSQPAEPWSLQVGGF